MPCCCPQKKASASLQNGLGCSLWPKGKVHQEIPGAAWGGGGGASSISRSGCLGGERAHGTTPGGRLGWTGRALIALLVCSPFPCVTPVIPGEIPIGPAICLHPVLLKSRGLLGKVFHPGGWGEVEERQEEAALPFPLCIPMAGNDACKWGSHLKPQNEQAQGTVKLLIRAEQKYEKNLGPGFPLFIP